MRNDGISPVQSRDCSVNNSAFLPNSFRALSSYLRSVSANAGSIASSVRTAGAAMAAGVATSDDDRRREQVQWAGFDILDLGPFQLRHVLLLTYANGFQVWDVHEASNVRELVSRRDGPTPCLHLLPRPILPIPSDSPRHNAGPLLAVVASLSTDAGGGQGARFYGSQGGGYGNQQQGYAESFGTHSGAAQSKPDVAAVRFYSLQHHMYVHTLEFAAPVVALRCSCRLVVVALATQIFCFDAITYENVFTVLSYPAPQAVPGIHTTLHGAMALGPRWLAYAANQPLLPSTGRVSPQHLSPSPGASPSTSPANGGGSAALVAHYAKESSRHLAAGIVTLGDMGYKTVSKYWSDLVLDGTSAPRGGGISPKSGSSTPRQAPVGAELEHGGMVIVRDVVSKGVVAQFRAHSSPISALAFDPSGTLLVTASVCGHNLNVFRLTTGCHGTGGDTSAAHVHLYKLYRGLTNAVIQDITFSSDSRWIAVSSTRGTTHLYAISPFGGPVGPETHAAPPSDGSMASSIPAALSLPWWSPHTPLRVHPSVAPSPPPPITLTVVSRIKNGTGGWAGSVTGVAATAAGRPNGISGAVAVAFHSGGEVEGASSSGSCLSAQLWVLSPVGHLIRYLLKPYATGESERQGTGVSYGHGSASGVESTPAPELRLEIQPLEKWDVCRRPGWVERDESLQSVASHSKWGGREQDEGGLALSAGGEGEGGREGANAEEMQRWFMSNAEVMQAHHGRSVPIWARPHIHFHDLLHGPSGGSASSGGSGASSNGSSSNSGSISSSSNLITLQGITDMNIEEIPTRSIEVRRRDLVPLCERSEGAFVGSHSTRDRNGTTQTGNSVLRMSPVRSGEDIRDKYGLSTDRQGREILNGQKMGFEVPTAAGPIIIHSGSSISVGVNGNYPSTINGTSPGSHWRHGVEDFGRSAGTEQKTAGSNGSLPNGLFHVDYGVGMVLRNDSPFRDNGHSASVMRNNGLLEASNGNWAVQNAQSHEGYGGMGIGMGMGGAGQGYEGRNFPNGFGGEEWETGPVSQRGGGHLAPFGCVDGSAALAADDGHSQHGSESAEMSGESTPVSSCESAPSPPLQATSFRPSRPSNLATQEASDKALMGSSKVTARNVSSSEGTGEIFNPFSSNPDWSLKESNRRGSSQQSQTNGNIGSLQVRGGFGGSNGFGTGASDNEGLFIMENRKEGVGACDGMKGEFCESSLPRRGNAFGWTDGSASWARNERENEEGRANWLEDRRGETAGALNESRERDGIVNEAVYCLEPEREIGERLGAEEQEHLTIEGIMHGEDDPFGQQNHDRFHHSRENSMDGWDFGPPDEDLKMALSAAPQRGTEGAANILNPSCGPTVTSEP